MSHALFRIGHFAGRHPWRVIAVWLILAVSMVMLNSNYGGDSTEKFNLPGADSQRAADALEDRFPQKTLYTSNIIFHSPDGLERGEVKTAIRQAVSQLADADHVLGVSDPFDPRSTTLSADGETAFATVGHATQEVGPTEFKAAEAATRQVQAAGVQVEYDGGLGHANPPSEPSSELIGVVAAVVVLLIAFGSLVAAVLPVLAAVTAILVGISAIGVLSGQVAVPQIASVVGLMLALGVGIDYALFILSRHRQNLERGMPVPEATGTANATAGLSVLFAGVTVVVAISGMQLSGIPMLAVMGWASALMVAVTVLAALTLLPALLGLAGRRVNSLRVPFLRPRLGGSTRSASARWAALVVSRPVVSGVAAALVLAVLAIPVFSMRLGFADAGNDSPQSTTRQAYDLMAAAYGPGVNGPFLIAVDGGATKVDNTTLSSLGRVLDTSPGVASLSAPVLNDDGTLALLELTPTTGPQDERTSELLQRLREEVLPGVVGDGGAEALVTGTAPLQDDVAQRLGDRMGWFLGAVIGLSMILLMLVFRSVLIPLKAAVLNLLSVAAAYGVVVAVFQWGWGAHLIGVHEQVPIMPLAPMLMFAILFGLSMDYEVFLLSRMREHYEATGHAKQAIVQGVGSTGRVISSAALIMIAVFGAFILASDVTTKLFGVGLALAVILDVTLVRMVLVPAAMSLLGARAWWLPGWLNRILPTVDLDATESSPSHNVANPVGEQTERQLV